MVQTRSKRGPSPKKGKAAEAPKPKSSKQRAQPPKSPKAPPKSASPRGANVVKKPQLHHRAKTNVMWQIRLVYAMETTNVRAQ